MMLSFECVVREVLYRHDLAFSRALLERRQVLSEKSYKFRPW